MLTLIIKGNADEARKACTYNGITVTDATEHATFDETRVHIADSFEHDVHEWFIASCRDDDRSPYPVGTLLWYGSNERD